MRENISPQLALRIVRYDELRECKGAFIDTYFKGSESKVNFQVIGGGVVENPDKHVHITIPHGFNIGGTRKAPGVVNNQHSHTNSEVFLVHRGRYRMILGPNGEDGDIEVAEGDVISFPTHLFRGFQCIGEETGHLVSVLGTPAGKVTWAPYVFSKARELGLILLDNGQVVDTRKGEVVPDHTLPVTPTVESDLFHFRRLTVADMSAWYLRHQQLGGCANSPLNREGVEECLIIGVENPSEHVPAAPISHPHDYHVRRIRIHPGAQIPWHARREVEVVFVHRGSVEIELRDGCQVVLNQGDLITLPIAAFRTWRNPGSETNELHIVRGSNYPDGPVWE